MLKECLYVYKIKMKFILFACIVLMTLYSVEAVMGADRGRQNDYHKIKTPLYKPEAERNQGKESRVSEVSLVSYLMLILKWKAIATDKVEKDKDALKSSSLLSPTDTLLVSATAASTSKATYVPEIPQPSAVSSSCQLVAGAVLSGMCALMMI